MAPAWIGHRKAKARGLALVLLLGGLLLSGLLLDGGAVLFRSAEAGRTARSPFDGPRRGEGKFVFVACPGPDGGFGRCGWSQPHEEIYEQRGASVRRLTERNSMKRSLAWSPDARRLAFSAPYSPSSGDDCPAFSLETQGLRRTLLEDDEWCAQPVDWSPDGGWVLLNISYYEGASQIFRVRPDGTGMRQITCHNPHVQGTAGGFFVSGGKAIVYSADNIYGEHGIYRVRADGTHRRLLHDATTFDFDISPDRKTLVFETNHESRRPGEIYMMGVDGSNLRRLTHNDTDEMGLAFSPDGSMVAFGIAERPGRPPIGISVVDVATGDVTRLALPDDLRIAGADVRLVWSPDGTRVAFVAGTLQPRRQAVFWNDLHGETQRATDVAPSMSLWGWLPEDQ